MSATAPVLAVGIAVISALPPSMLTSIGVWLPIPSTIPVAAYAATYEESAILISYNLGIARDVVNEIPTTTTLIDFDTEMISWLT